MVYNASYQEMLFKTEDGYSETLDGAKHTYDMSGKYLGQYQPDIERPCDIFLAWDGDASGAPYLTPHEMSRAKNKPVRIKRIAL
jgi:hypothetical protein